MWLALFVVFGAIFVAVAGILSGGIFTIILVPLAALALLAWAGHSAFVYLTTSVAPQGEGEASGAALPHTGRTNTVSRPATPDDLVNARQRQ